MSQKQLACQLATKYQQACPNHQSLEHGPGTAARRGAGRACCGQGEGAGFQQQEHVMPVASLQLAVRPSPGSNWLWTNWIWLLVLIWSYFGYRNSAYLYQSRKHSTFKIVRLFKNSNSSSQIFFPKEADKQSLSSVSEIVPPKWWAIIIPPFSGIWSLSLSTWDRRRGKTRLHII